MTTGITGRINLSISKRGSRKPARLALALLAWRARDAKTLKYLRFFGVLA